MKKGRLFFSIIIFLFLLSLALAGVSEMEILQQNKNFVQEIKLNPCEEGVEYSVTASGQQYLSVLYSTKDENGHIVLEGYNGLFTGALPLRYTAGNQVLSFEIRTPMQQRIALAKLPLSLPETDKIAPQAGAVRKINDLVLKAGVNKVSYSFSAPGHSQVELNFRTVMQKGKTIVQADENGLFSGKISLPFAYASDLVTVKILSPKGQLMAEDSIRLAFAEFPLGQPNPRGPLSGVKVCLDPGHQAQKANTSQVFHMPGSTKKVKGGSSGMAQGCLTLRKESVVVLEIAYRTASRLQALGAEVIMTRTTEDTSVSNFERAEIANQSNADYFIRIHLNMFKSKTTHAVFVYCPLNSPYAKEAANKETYQLLANALLDEFMLSTGAAPGYTRFSDQFIANNWGKMPTFLLEAGNMSTPSDDLLASQPFYQEKMAEGIVNGVLQMHQITQNSKKDK